MKSVLAIESSFDDLSVAIIHNNVEYQSSSRACNGPWGGGVPEINARHHLEYIEQLVQETLNKANITIYDIDVFGATAGPGIQSGLLVGYEYVKFLAQRLKKPFIPVHHMEAHLLTAKNTSNNEKSLSLLISGGHSMIVLDHGDCNYEEVCTTRDIAIGEVFDKIARAMGLGFPGGPEIEKRANPNFQKRLPIPAARGDFFSFSGIATALLKEISKYSIEDMAALTQNTLAHILKQKIEYLMKINPTVKDIVENGVIEVSGGVAANQFIKKLFQQTFSQVQFAPKYLCGDNGIMIARCALLHYSKNYKIKTDIFSRMPLNQWSTLIKQNA